MLKTNFTENNVDKILHAYTHSDNGNDNSQRFKFPYITTVYFFLIFQHSNASTHARPYITFKLSSLSLSRSNILKCSIVSFMWSAHTYCIYYFVFSLSLVPFSSLPQLWCRFLFKMLLRMSYIASCSPFYTTFHEFHSVDGLCSLAAYLKYYLFLYSFSNQNLNVFSRWLLLAAARIR